MYFKNETDLKCVSYFYFSKKKKKILSVSICRAGNGSEAYVSELVWNFLFGMSRHMIFQLL
jgi:hypothetical protein